MQKKNTQNKGKPEILNLKKKAYELFKSGLYTQKQIAVMLGISQKTMSKWSKAENWKDAFSLHLISDLETDLEVGVIESITYEEFIKSLHKFIATAQQYLAKIKKMPAKVQ